MKLTINGVTREFDEICTLSELLKTLGLEGKPLVIELNREALAPSEFRGRPLTDDDSLEIITIAAGG